MSTWIRACAVDDIDPEDVVGFEHEGKDYAVYRLEDDSIHATAGHCTHERELLCNGLVMDGIIECPRHNGQFEVTTGKAVRSPAREDLATYPTKVEDGSVYVELA